MESLNACLISAAHYIKVCLLLGLQAKSNRLQLEAEGEAGWRRFERYEALHSLAATRL